MRGPLTLLLVAAALNVLSWIILIPVWQYPDEQAHFAQVQRVAEVGNSLYGNSAFDTSREVAISEEILGTARDGMGNNKFTYHPEAKLTYQNSQDNPGEHEISSLPKSARSEFVKREATVNPPLYYNLAALVYKLFSWGDLFTRVYAIRIFSALIFLATVFVAYKIGTLIFKSQHMSLALASIVATKPMLVFATTGALPDTLTILLFSIFILVCLSILQKGWSTLKIGLLILTIASGAATRQNFLISLAVLPFVIFHQLIVNKKSRVTQVTTLILTLAALFIASYFVPALDFIHRFDYPESSRKIPDSPLANLTYLEHLNWTARHSIAEVWPWFWGVYKWLSLTLPPIVYQIINRLVPIAIFGLVIKIFLVIKKRDWQNNAWLFFLIFVVMIYFLALTTFDFLHRRNNGFSFGIQGRYFFPVIIPILVLILAGVSKLFETMSQNLAKIGIFVLTALFFIFNDFSLAYVSSSYYLTSDLATFIKHASQYKPEIFKGYIILVIISSTVILQTIFLSTFYRYIMRKTENESS